jgi:CHAT domain-containing protein/tetratricopeptide (TPR) repeat protein
LFAAVAAVLLSGASLPARTAQTPGAPVDSAVLLKPRVSVERAIGGSERHAYDVELQAGDYAALVVDQLGVDVAIRILDESGAVIAVFDQEAQKDGREHVAVVADASRAYRLTVSPRYPRLDAGRYAVWIEQIRPATDADRAMYEARRLSVEASNLQDAGNLDDALARATRAAALAEKAAGAQDAYVGALVGERAAVEKNKGQLRQAEQSVLRAIDISQAALGREHPQTVDLLEWLGIVYNAMEDYAKAEPLLTEAVAITERTLGPEHPRLAVYLRNLALLYTNRGDNMRSVAVLQRAHEIADRTLLPDDFNAIALDNNLGDVFITMKEYARAEPYLERSLRAVERTFGPDNYRIATPLFNLAIVARERGDYATALQELQRAYDLREKIYGKEHTATAAVLITVGNVYHAQGDYDAALAAYQRAYDVLERTAGPYHSFTMMAVSNAARTYTAAGKLDEALQYEARFDARLDKTIDFNLAIGSEREKIAYLQGAFEKMGRTISLHLRQAAGSSKAADLAALAILRCKGRVLEALSDNRAALRARLDPGDRTLLDELSSVTGHMATLALNGPGRLSPVEYHKKLTALEQQHESLESRISSRSAEFRAASQPITVAAVRSALPHGSALLEFVVYQPFNPKASTDKDAHGAPRYAVYVIRRDGQTRGVDLGPAAVIDAAVARTRAALRDPARHDVAVLARRLDELVFRRVRPLAGDAAQLLVAPDGALNLIPFEALVDERGRFQVERYAISYLGSGRDLLRMQVPRPSGNAPLVIADPAFGEPALDATTPAAGRAASTPAAADTVYFAPLDATAQEAAAIGRLLPGATVLTGMRASKSALFHANAPSILHIASHAFFVPDEGEKTEAPLAGTRSMRANVTSPNPLLRSGIALAGANLSRRDNDGILTALEASTLNLWGTRLVTLSACDTGVGDVKNGEGVYGLRRAFFVAGAETLVMSLWPVSDYMTRHVMTDYYAGLARGDGRGAALRHVQLAMLRTKDRRHPFYWAGFIQAGAWGPLSNPR